MTEGLRLGLRPSCFCIQIVRSGHGEEGGGKETRREAIERGRRRKDRQSGEFVGGDVLRKVATTG